MLVDRSREFTMTEADLAVFRALLPPEHILLDALKYINWDAFIAILARYYSPNLGQPALPPLIMLKLLYLGYHYRLGDLELMRRADTDLLFRWFLQVPMRFRLPDESLLVRFRARLGVEGIRSIFNQLVQQARDKGIVRDRLRLKDATHVLADIAVPTTLKLFAQLREQMLKKLTIFDPQVAEGLNIAADEVREQTRSGNIEARLAARVDLLKLIMSCVAKLPEPDQAASNRDWQKLLQLRAFAEKLLSDQANPKAKHRQVSVHDPDACRGKHGDWYEGYVLDVMMDGDSKIITEMNLLRAGGNEAESGVEMVKREQETYGNQIDTYSIDGAGFQGPALRAMEDLHVETVVPPKKISDSEVFAADEFELVENGKRVRCPAGKVSQYSQRNADKNSTTHRFKRADCVDCVLLSLCVAQLGTGPFGRSLNKNDYEPEYDRARALASTPEYAEIRAQHPAVERKLNEIVNHHDGRHARYRGQAKVLFQELTTGFTVNLKQIVTLLRDLCCASPQMQALNG